MAALLWAIDDIVKLRLTFSRNFQADGKRLAGRGTRVRFCSRQLAIRIAAQVQSFRSLSASAVGDALLHVVVGALFFWSEVAISLACFKQLKRGGAVLWRVVGLKDEVFVVIETEPLESFDNRTRRLVGGALQIGVFDAE